MHIQDLMMGGSLILAFERLISDIMDSELIYVAVTRIIYCI